MAMGKRPGRGRPPSIWVASTDLPRSAGHPFYERLNRVLDEAEFDAFVTFLRQLAAASGIATPTRAELDRKHPKKGSNDDWTHPKDPDAKVTKMKDGRTRLAHKAEHAVDLETGAVVGRADQPPAESKILGVRVDL